MMSKMSIFLQNYNKIIVKAKVKVKMTIKLTKVKFDIKVIFIEEATVKETVTINVKQKYCLPCWLKKC